MRKIAVTGVSSYFAQMLVPRVLSAGETEEIVGIDVKQPSLTDERLRFVKRDVRDPGIEELFRGTDAVVHLAYVVQEIRDKKETHDINIRGSRNVVHAAGRAGVPHLVVASSVAAYGAHPDNPPRLRESDRLRGNERCYYSHDKAAVERELDVTEKEFPPLIVTRLRPCTIVGPRAQHAIAELPKRRGVVSPRGFDPEVQLLCEDDLAEAFYLTLKARRPGAFNITPDDWVLQSELFRMAGVRVYRPPLPIARLVVDVAFRFGVAPYSSDWVELLLYGIVADNAKAKQELGWKPTLSSREAFATLLPAAARG